MSLTLLIMKLYCGFPDLVKAKEKIALQLPCKATYIAAPSSYYLSCNGQGKKKFVKN